MAAQGVVRPYQVSAASAMNNLPVATALMDCKQFITGLCEEQSGQDVVEYALVLAALATVIVAGSNSVAAIITNGVTTILAKVQSLL